MKNKCLQQGDIVYTVEGTAPRIEVHACPVYQDQTKDQCKEGFLHVIVNSRVQLRTKGNKEIGKGWYKSLAKACCVAEAIREDYIHEVSELLWTDIKVIKEY